LLRDQRCDDNAVRPRLNADESGDNRVAERRMVVVPAARVVALEPLAGTLVEIFADVRLPVLVVRSGVNLHRLEVVARRPDVGDAVADLVGQRVERLRCRERPDGAVPLAAADAVAAKLRVPPLGRRDAAGRPEALWVEELPPG